MEVAEITDGAALEMFFQRLQASDPRKHRLIQANPRRSPPCCGSLRSWFADKIKDRAHFLAEPDRLIAMRSLHTLIRWACRLRLAPQTVARCLLCATTTASSVCSARACNAGDKKANCICYNSRRTARGGYPHNSSQTALVFKSSISAFQPYFFLQTKRTQWCAVPPYGRA
jgi:hypothetical protein